MIFQQKEYCSDLIVGEIWKLDPVSLSSVLFIAWFLSQLRKRRNPSQAVFLSLRILRKANYVNINEGFFVWLSTLFSVIVVQTIFLCNFYRSNIFTEWVIE